MIKINLKYWRTMRVLTIRELSKLSGVSTATIVAIENGKNKSVRPGPLRKLAKALGIEMSQLVVDEEFAKIA